MIWKRQVLVQPVLSMLLANNIACGAKVLWVVDSLLSRLGFLLDDDKTPQRYATVGRGETTNLGLLVSCLWFVFGLVKSTTYGTN